MAAFDHVGEDAHGVGGGDSEFRGAFKEERGREAGGRGLHAGDGADWIQASTSGDK